MLNNKSTLYNNKSTKNIYSQQYEYNKKNCLIKGQYI